MPGNFCVDKNSVIPVYRQLVNWMVGNISVGDWPPGYRLGAEVELSKELHVSRGSLRKAIGILVARQMLVQVHGKGTFVRSVIIEQPLASDLVGVSEKLLEAGVPFTTQILAQGIIPAVPKVAQSLDLKPGDEVFYLKRVRSVGSDPIVLNESYLPARRFGALVTVDFSKERLFSTLEEMFGVRLAWASRSIAAIRTEPEEAQYLNVEIGSPMLYNEQIVYDEESLKVEFSKGWFPGDRFRLKAVVKRNAAGGLSSISLPVA